MAKTEQPTPCYGPGRCLRTPVYPTVTISSEGNILVGCENCTSIPVEKSGHIFPVKRLIFCRAASGNIIDHELTVKCNENDASLTDVRQELEDRGLKPLCFRAHPFSSG